MDYNAIVPVETGKYLDAFTKEKYPKAFAEYCTKAEEQLRLLAGDPEQGTAELVAWMDTQVKGFFKRRKRLEQELLLMQYAVPAAIRLNFMPLAQTLAAQWNRVHPDYSFGAASYEEFYGSFNTTLLGFKIDKGDSR